MVRKVAYIILFSVSWVLGFGQTKKFWYPENLQEYEIVRFAGDDLEGNLWLITSQGTLIQKSSDGLITEFKIPEVENSSVHGFVSREGIIYLSYNDIEYHTRFFYGHPLTGWNEFDEAFPNAIRNFIQTESGDIYAYGDWGSLLEFDSSSNSYKKLPFSYQQHIRTMAERDGRLYLGVRNVGLVEYDHGKSKVLKGSENISSDIDDIYKSDENLHPAFLTMRGRVYRWETDRYQIVEKAPINRSATLGIYTAQGIPGFAGAYGQVYMYANKEWVISDLPANNQIIEFHLSRNEVLYVIDSSGKLFSLRKSGTLFFTNYTRQEAMIGNSINKTMNLQYVDVNKDERMDITLNNTGVTNRINIYIQYQNGLYREESARFFDDFPMNIEQVWFQDISEDGRTDLLIMYNKDSHFYIDSYLQFRTKFMLHQQLAIHSDSAQSLKDFALTDIDGDSDLDLLLAFYFAEGRQKGTLSLLENVGHGKFELQSNISPDYRQWANTLWAGDLNQDGIQEVIIGTYWSPDIIISGDFKEGNSELYYLPDSANTTDILTADFDKDGKAELIRNSWEFGLQIFDVSPDLTFKLYQDFYRKRSVSVHSYSLVDINMDSWMDIIVTGISENEPFSHVLVNQEGELQQIDATEIGLDESLNQRLIPLDFDRDGDPDIIALREGENKIYENHQNPEHVLRLINNGSKGQIEQWTVSQNDSNIWAHQSNTSGIGNGVGEYILGLISTNNVKIKTEKNTAFNYQLKDAEGVNELTVIPKLSIFKKAGMLFSYLIFVFHMPAFYYYIITVLLGTLILMLTYYIGARKLDWEWKSLVTITLANSTLFWILLALSVGMSELWRYGIPLSGVAAGSILPVFFSLQNRLFHASKSAEDAKLQMLDLLLRFTHGAWSNSVINRFKMLLLNVSYNDDDGIIEQLHERKKSFLNIVLPELREIHNLMIAADYNKLQIQMLGDAIAFFEQKLVQAEQDLTRNAEKISKKLEDLRNVLRAIRNTTWINFSCDMIEVVQQVTDLHRDNLRTENIHLERRTEGSKEAWVLTPPGRMAEIIDNIILNAIEALKNTEERELMFYIYHKAPKWVLEITDTGSGIKEELVEKIFESGYSNHNSSGQGLYKSRETLQQFGGRISVQQSNVGKGTTFKIECLEGVAP